MSVVDPKRTVQSWEKLPRPLTEAPASAATDGTALCLSQIHYGGRHVCVCIGGCLPHRLGGQSEYYVSMRN